MGDSGKKVGGSREKVGESSGERVGDSGKKVGESGEIEGDKVPPPLAHLKSGIPLEVLMPAPDMTMTFLYCSLLSPHTTSSTVSESPLLPPHLWLGGRLEGPLLNVRLQLAA